MTAPEGASVMPDPSAPTPQSADYGTSDHPMTREQWKAESAGSPAGSAEIEVRECALCGEEGEAGWPLRWRRAGNGERLLSHAGCWTATDDQASSGCTVGRLPSRPVDGASEAAKADS